MSENAVINKSKKGRSFFSLMKTFLKMDSSLAEVIHVQFLPQIFYMVAVSLLCIGNRHYAEKKIRNIYFLESEVEDLRADYTTLKADYMYMKKLSVIKQRVHPMGLRESNVSPTIVSKNGD